MNDFKSLVLFIEELVKSKASIRPTFLGWIPIKFYHKSDFMIKVSQPLSDIRSNFYHKLGTDYMISDKMTEVFRNLTNGISIFTTLNVYGVYGGKTSAVSFDIMNANVNDKSILVNKDFELIGAYFSSGDKIFIDVVGGSVYRADKDLRSIRNTWNSFEDFLKCEIVRLYKIYQKNPMSTINSINERIIFD